MESTRDKKRDGEEEEEAERAGNLGIRVEFSSSSPSWFRTSRLISDAKEKGMILGEMSFLRYIKI